VTPISLVLADYALDALSLHLQFRVVQWMANRFLVRFGEPSLASLIFALVQDEVVREFGNGFHSAILTGAWVLRTPAMGMRAIDAAHTMTAFRGSAQSCRTTFSSEL